MLHHVTSLHLKKIMKGNKTSFQRVEQLAPDSPQNRPAIRTNGDAPGSVFRRVGSHRLEKMLVPLNKDMEHQ